MIGIPLTHAIGALHILTYFELVLLLPVKKGGEWFWGQHRMVCLMSRASTADLSLGVDSFNGRGELQLISARTRYEMKRHI